MGKSNVFLYVPNLIGYTRILLLGCSFFLILSQHRLAMILYSASYLLDAVDGLAARLLNQSSLFGTMLDMVTDRASTLCLLMTLGHLYPSHFFAFQVLLVLDVVSHWLHFFATNIQGRTSHKTSSEEDNFLMRLYYQNKLVLTSTCAMEQLFYCSLAVAHFESEPMLLWPALVSSPALLFKNYINLLQVYDACRVMAKADPSHQ